MPMSWWEGRILEASSTQFVDIEGVLPWSYHMLPLTSRSHLTWGGRGFGSWTSILPGELRQWIPGSNGQTINDLTSNSKKDAITG